MSSSDETPLTFRSTKNRTTTAPRFDRHGARDEVANYICQLVRSSPKTQLDDNDWQEIADSVNAKFPEEGKDGLPYWKPAMCRYRWDVYGVHNTIIQKQSIAGFWLKKWVDKAIRHPEGKREQELVRDVEAGEQIGWEILWDCRKWLDEKCFQKQTEDGKKFKGEAVEAYGPKPSWYTKELAGSNIDWMATAYEALDEAEKLDKELSKVRQERNAVEEVLWRLRKSIDQYIPREYRGALDGLDD